jgi:two-component system, cell cycle sensor histidine kinase and response regulator CckA
VRALTERVLRRLGYTVWTAADGEEALDKVASIGRRLDLVIADVVLPGMDGGRLVERLREVQPGLSALFMSGYAGIDLTNFESRCRWRRFASRT